MKAILGKDGDLSIFLLGSAERLKKGPILGEITREHGEEIGCILILQFNPDLISGEMIKIDKDNQEPFVSSKRQTLIIGPQGIKELGLEGGGSIGTSRQHQHIEIFSHVENPFT